MNQQEEIEFLRARNKELETMINLAVQDIDRLESDLLDWEHEVPVCDEHRPKGLGHRSGCPYCSNMELTMAISKIDYLIGVPNVFEASIFDVEQEPADVITRLIAFLGNEGLLTDSKV